MVKADRQSEITGDLEWIMPVVVPSFIAGADAKRIYDLVYETLKQGSYDESSKTMIGSNLPIVARVDSIVRPLGMRVANLSDLSRREIMGMVKDQHYSDTPAIVARSDQDSYSPNRQIIAQILPTVEQKQGKLKFPFMITGFDAELFPGNEYGWRLVPRDDFNVLHDERLDSKYGGKTFSTVDEIGLPLFDKKGSRTWYARDQGLSRLFLGRDLNLDSYDEDLSYSYASGRVVVVCGEAAEAVLSREYIQKARESYETRKSELDGWLADSLARMPGGKR